MGHYSRCIIIIVIIIIIIIIIIIKAAHTKNMAPLMKYSRLNAYTSLLQLEFLLTICSKLLTLKEPCSAILTSRFAEAAQLFTLKVSLKKTEVLHQPSPQGVHHAPSSHWPVRDEDDTPVQLHGVHDLLRGQARQGNLQPTEKSKHGI